jgi:hypothetical protein
MNDKIKNMIDQAFSVWIITSEELKLIKNIAKKEKYYHFEYLEFCF